MAHPVLNGLVVVRQNRQVLNPPEIIRVSSVFDFIDGNACFPCSIIVRSFRIRFRVRSVQVAKPRKVDAGAGSCIEIRDIRAILLSWQDKQFVACLFLLASKCASAGQEKLQSIPVRMDIAPYVTTTTYVILTHTPYRDNPIYM